MSRKLLSCVLFVSCSVATLFCGAFNLTNGLEMQVHVSLPDGGPAAFVRVSVRDEYSAKDLSAGVTDSAGNIKLPLNTDPVTPVCSDRKSCMGNAMIVPSQYYVKVLAEGYAPYEGRFSVNNTGVGMASISLSPHNAAAVPEEARHELAVARGLLDSKQPQAALQHLQNALLLDPSYADAYQLLGLAQMQTGHIEEARAAESKALNLNADLTNAYFVLALTQNLSGDSAAAERSLNAFLARDPENAAGHFEMARTEFTLNRFAAAETHAREALSRNPSMPAAQLVLAYALLRQQKGQDAISAFHKYLDMLPTSPIAGDIKSTIAQIEQHESNLHR